MANFARRPADGSWREVWRKGFAPLLSTGGLEALRKALRSDDARLLQGATCTPPPLACVVVQDWPVEAACLIGFCRWQDGTEEATTVADVEEYFAKACFEADQAIGKPGVCRWLLSWFDDTPRDEVLRELLPEVELALSQRTALAR